MTRRRQSVPKRRRSGRSVADAGGGLDDPGVEAAGPDAAGPDALRTGSLPLVPSLTAAMSALTRKSQGVQAWTAPSAVSGTACPPSSCARCAATLAVGYAGTPATDATVRVAPGAWNRSRRIGAPPDRATLTALPFPCATYPTSLSPPPLAAHTKLAARTKPSSRPLPAVAGFRVLRTVTTLYMIMLPGARCRQGRTSQAEVPPARHVGLGGSERARSPSTSPHLRSAGSGRPNETAQPRECGLGPGNDMPGEADW